MHAEHFPFLLAKVQPPLPRVGGVRRPRLLARLDDALTRPFTLLAAPAGYGKTTLLAEWGERLKDEGGRMKDEGDSGRLKSSRAAWLALDEADQDPARLARGVIAAFSQIWPACATLAEALNDPAEGAEAVLAALLAQLALSPHPGGPWVLVLDDLHLAASPAALAALAFMVENLPANVRVLAATRADPDLPLALWRARNLLSEVRAPDLRFTPEEAAAFLRDAMGLSLAPDEAAHLASRAEGWAAGLQLAALAVQDGGPGMAGVEQISGRHRYVFDYLASEVLQRQPEPVQRFLLRTSILNTLSAPLCSAVCAESDEAGFDGQAMLERLERANLFLVPLDAERHWFRYHHLFAEFLRARLRERWPEQVASLHIRASQWFEAAGRPVEAVEHALAAGDEARLVAVLPWAINELIRVGQNRTTARWLESLPQALVLAYPPLALWKAWHLSLPGAPVEVEEYLEAALRGASTDDAEGRGVYGQAALIRCQVAQARGQLAEAEALAAEALEWLPEDYASLRALAGLHLGQLALWRGQFRRADEHLSEALRLVALGQHPGIYGRVSLEVLKVRLSQGRLDEAAEVAHRLLSRIPDPSLLRGAARQAHLGLWEVALERGDLAAADGHWQAALAHSQALAGMGMEPGFVAGAWLAGAWLSLVAGEPGEARRRLALGEQALPQTPALRGWRRPAWLARVRLALGEVAAAAQAFPFVPEAAPTSEAEFEHLTLARLWLAQGRTEAALALLRERLPAAEADGRTAHVLENLLLQSRAHQAEGRLGQAAAALACSLAAGEPLGFWQMYAVEAPAQAEVLRACASRRGPAGRMARRLLSALSGGAVPGAGGQLAAPAGDAERPRLTPHEQRVLRLIAAGRTNAAIASEMGVSVNTVRTHAKNLFRKLDAHSRTQAVAQARAAGLL